MLGMQGSALVSTAKSKNHLVSLDHRMRLAAMPAGQYESGM